MNPKLEEAYQSILHEIFLFNTLKYKTTGANVGREGIIRGLEIALEKILEADK